MRPSLLGRVLATSAVAVALAGCADLAPRAAAPTPTPTATRTPAPSAEDRAVTAAVGRFSSLLEAGDVAALGRPGAVLTAEVVRSLNSEQGGCEDAADVLLNRTDNIALTVQRIATRTDLANVRVERPRGGTVVITLVRADRRWLVSFSGIQNPLAAVLG